MSEAYDKFVQNKSDFERLMEIHNDYAGDTPGRKYKLHVLNKSAIIMTCSCWEAFVEDIAIEAAKKLSQHLPDPKDVPKAVIDCLAKNILGNKDTKKLWDVFTLGWKEAIVSNAKFVTREKNGFGLNNPKSVPVRDVMRSCLGLEDVCSFWYWKGMSRKKAAEKLDAMVVRRGEFAHHNPNAQNVSKAECLNFMNHVSGVVDCTEWAINKHLEDLTGVGFDGEA